MSQPDKQKSRFWTLRIAPIRLAFHFVDNIEPPAYNLHLYQKRPAEFWKNVPTGAVLVEHRRFVHRRS